MTGTIEKGTIFPGLPTITQGYSGRARRLGATSMVAVDSANLANNNKTRNVRGANND
jgi:hypothetical protein